LEYSTWQTPVAVFAPASGTDFDFDALLHRAINAEHDDDLEDYAIEPVVLSDDHLPPTSPNPPGSLPLTLPTSPRPPPPLPSSAATSGPSRHAPPKPGTNELAYRKARGKAREKVKAQQRKDAASYGNFAVKPRMVNKHIKKPGQPIRTSLNTGDMPHASTGYVGMQDSGGTGRVFELEQLIGKDSEHDFELRKWDGR
jgi:hypothetical protein